jgi:hypothetical protein
MVSMMPRTTRETAALRLRSSKSCAQHHSSSSARTTPGLPCALGLGQVRASFLSREDEIVHRKTFLLDTCESGGRALRIGLREFEGPKVGLPDRDLGHSRRLCPRSAREADTVPLLVLLVNTRSVLAPPGLSQTGLPTQRR